jgi:hypothetical protein
MPTSLPVPPLYRTASTILDDSKIAGKCLSERAQEWSIFGISYDVEKSYIAYPLSE